MAARRVALVLAGAVASVWAAPGLAQDFGAQRSGLSMFISPAGQVFRASSERDPLDSWWNQVDANHDDQVSEAEMVADFERLFREIDANHDGVLSQAEIANYQQSFRSDAALTPSAVIAPAPPGGAPAAGAGGRGGPGGRLGSPGGPPGRPAPGAAGVGGAASPAPRAGLARYNPLGEDNPLMAGDLNSDGQITLEEFRLKAQRSFLQLDLSGDGQLRRIELPALGEPQRGRTNAGSLPSNRPW